MALVANNPKAAKRLGIPRSVGEEFMKADKGRKFKEGGALKAVDSGENPGLSKLPTEVRNKMGYMKKGGMAKSYKEGGKADIAQDKKMTKKAVGMHEKQLHGGKKSDLSALKKGGRIAAKGEHAVQKHSKRGAEMVKMAKGGCAKMAKGGGIEKKGKTKGRII